LTPEQVELVKGLLDLAVELRNQAEEFAKLPPQTWLSCFICGRCDTIMHAEGDSVDKYDDPENWPKGWEEVQVRQFRRVGRRAMCPDCANLTVENRERIYVRKSNELQLKLFKGRGKIITEPDWEVVQ
jgi:hypothetical protein